MAQPSFFIKYSHVIAIAALLGVGWLSSVAMALDRISLPPLQEEFYSPNQRFKFVVSTSDGWKSRRSTGALFKQDGKTYTLLWRRKLPHSYRPRFVLVGKAGEVLLLDEWINVTSPYAVMLLDRDNLVIAQHDFDAVQRVLGIPGAAIVRAARYGVWMTQPPELAATGDVALVKSAGKVLGISLLDGHLFLRQNE